MNLFIDTNVYLTFYYFSSDDLEELKKLLVAIRDKKIYLFLPQQTYHEFKRNREGKIADALKKIDDQKLPSQYPQLCKEYDEYPELIKLKSAYEETKRKLLEKLLNDVKEKSLKADEVILEIFRNAIFISTDDSILSNAKKRFDIGNPPGKDSSYGDAINWESLLFGIPDGKDVHLVARDKDYTSRLDEDQLSSYLNDEWEKKKKSKIYFYNSLSSFFKSHFPDIKLAAEMEKQIAISDLISSLSYASTHYAVSRLGKYPDFTTKELNQIVEASLTNDQIYSIHDDDDIKGFFNSLVEGKMDRIDPQFIKKYTELYINPPTVKEDDEPPF